MADVTTLANALVANVKTISDLARRTYAYEPAILKEPLAWVVLDPDGTGGEFDQVLGNVAWWSFVVTAIAGRAAADNLAMGRVYAYVSSTGTKSLKRAIETDVTLGGAAHTLLVEDPQVDSVASDGAEYLAARVRVRVLA